MTGDRGASTDFLLALAARGAGHPSPAVDVPLAPRQDAAALAPPAAATDGRDDTDADTTDTPRDPAPTDDAARPRAERTAPAASPAMPGGAHPSAHDAPSRGRRAAEDDGSDAARPGPSSADAEDVRPPFAPPGRPVRPASSDAPMPASPPVSPLSSRPSDGSHADAIPTAPIAGMPGRRTGSPSSTATPAPRSGSPADASEESPRSGGPHPRDEISPPGAGRTAGPVDTSEPAPASRPIPLRPAPPSGDPPRRDAASPPPHGAAASGATGSGIGPPTEGGSIADALDRLVGDLDRRLAGFDWGEAAEPPREAGPRDAPVTGTPLPPPTAAAPAPAAAVPARPVEVRIGRLEVRAPAPPAPAAVPAHAEPGGRPTDFAPFAGRRAGRLWKGDR